MSPHLQRLLLKAHAALGFGKRNPEWVGGGDNEIRILLGVFIRLCIHSLKILRCLQLKRSGTLQVQTWSQLTF